ncbi:MAG: hypothetical protein ACTMKV_12380 [Sphingomonas parapaucimobilis]
MKPPERTEQAALPLGAVPLLHNRFWLLYSASDKPVARQTSRDAIGAP